MYFINECKSKDIRDITGSFVMLDNFVRFGNNIELSKYRNYYVRQSGVEFLFCKNLEGILKSSIMRADRRVQKINNFPKQSTNRLSYLLLSFKT